jgi:oligopeptide/dipeptide ABC transporter ATP-binding protein
VTGARATAAAPVAAAPAAAAPGPALLAVRGLTVAFPASGGQVAAVNGVDLEIAPGETYAMVGESGSGKSVTSLAIMGLLDRSRARLAGEIAFRDRSGRVRDLLSLGEREMTKVRGGEISMVFQEPMTSLNPVQTAGAQIAEAVRLHQGLGRAAAWTRAVEMLEAVEIPDAARRAGAYPHELSGGMRQRVMIAMALACRPALLIADEPTTALDVTVQLRVLRLLRRLQTDLCMGVLFVTHNLGVVAEVADRVGVMYGGRLVETATAAELFARPRHPYTRGLLDSLPRGGRGRLRAIPGSVVDPRRPPPGCAFSPRCDLAEDACRAAVPPLASITASQASRCLRWASL